MKVDTGEPSMTVGQLIDELSKQEPETTVCVLVSGGARPRGRVIFTGYDGNSGEALIFIEEGPDLSK